MCSLFIEMETWLLKNKQDHNLDISTQTNENFCLK